MDIVLARTEADLRQCFPVMVQLRPHLRPAEFINRVLQQRQEGYQLAYGRNEKNILVVAGFRLFNNLSHGKVLYVDDLVTDATVRSQGSGQQMLEWLAEYARAQGCAELHLDSGVQRQAAHRFYFREGMTITAFHFAKPV